MSLLFPIYADVVGKRCVVVGGGKVAERKVADLLAANAQICVVSPDVTPILERQAAENVIEWRDAPYSSTHLEGAWLVFAATNVRAVNAQVSQDALARRCFVNVADAPEESGFLVPSVVRRGDLCLSVSTGGNNPLLARKLSQELQAQYGPEYGLLVELLGQMRIYVKTRTTEPGQRRYALSQLIEHEVELRALLKAGSMDEARFLAESIVTGATTLLE